MCTLSTGLELWSHTLLKLKVSSTDHIWFLRENPFSQSLWSEPLHWQLDSFPLLLPEVGFLVRTFGEAKICYLDDEMSINPMGNDGSLLYICSGILKGITVQLHMQRYTYMQFRAARSRCTMFWLLRYCIPLAIWRHMSAIRLRAMWACDWGNGRMETILLRTIFFLFCQITCL